MIKLRDYQQECIRTIIEKGYGSYLIQMAVGLGKTVTFASLEEYFDRILILAHREELLKQPRKYFNCSYGIEQGRLKSNGEKVIASSVQSLVNRLDKFKTDDFDLIVIDEAHHSSAKTYKKIIDYFNPMMLLGFTATPNRADKVKLDDIYSDIIFERNLLWGIKNNYLSKIKCTRSYINVDYDQFKSSNGDYSIKSMSEVMETTGKQIRDIYYDNSCQNGRTLIFGVNIAHCEDIQKNIEDSYVIHAKTKNREKYINDFTKGEIKTLINVGIFTEGTDIPNIDNIIIARPTRSEGLYTQMVGRGTRQAINKDHLHLIDVVGCSSNLSLISAPSLLGVNMDDNTVKEQCKDEFSEVDIFDLPDLVDKASNTPNFYKINHKKINIWAKKNNYDMYDVNWIQKPDTSLLLSIPNLYIKTSPINEFGEIVYKGETWDVQTFFQYVKGLLLADHKENELLWNKQKIKGWGSKEMTYKQRRKLRDLNVHDQMTRKEAFYVIGGMMG